MSSGLGGLDPQNPAIGHLRDLWEITQDPNTDFTAKLDAVFGRETGELGLTYGFLSRIDADAGQQVIEAAHGGHDRLQPGATHPLSETYCRETVRAADRTFAVSDADAEGFDDDPAYQRFGFGSYLGATLTFDGETYGTLCFAGDSPRREPFSAGERLLVQLLADWASNELKQRETRTGLERQTTELANTISHDLRNPLSIAEGRLEYLDDSIEESIGTIERAHDRMNEIIENMLTLARISEPVHDPEAVDLRACARETWEMVATGGATLSVTFDRGWIDGDENRVKHLLENVFRNAIEHADEDASVELGLTESGFYVADDGEGIPAADRTIVFEPGYSTKSNGTGFGLSIVQRIADAHGWTVTITESESGGTRFEFGDVDVTLPDA